ncbi:MAG: peptidoglycan-binding protein [Candidatus Eisenbacteria bacterium]|nr:peptidoglycan-binding protein [Candidatus Eisenbacteria bacterium]
MRKEVAVGWWAVLALAIAAAWMPGPAAAGRAAARASGEQASVRSGARAQEVGRAAVALQKLGFYKGDTGGAWSPELHEAVRAFQKSRGLKATGRLNRDTRSALGLEPATKQSGKGDGAAKASRASGEEAP